MVAKTLAMPHTWKQWRESCFLFLKQGINIHKETAYGIFFESHCPPAPSSLKLREAQTARAICVPGDRLRSWSV